MRYNKAIILSNGTECYLRNETEGDGQLIVDNFNPAHSETGYLLTYPDGNNLNIEQKSQFLKRKAESEREIELLAIIDSIVAGAAGTRVADTKYKVWHRIEFGISIVKKYWGLGIGKALLASCIECVEVAGYNQLELKIVTESGGTVSMCKWAGFIKCGRNPKGFRSHIVGLQEVISIRLEL